MINCIQIFCVLIIFTEIPYGIKFANMQPTKASQVQGVIRILQINKSSGPLKCLEAKITFIFFSRMIELCKAPIYKTKLPLLVINHNIVGLHITMDDTLRVADI